MTRGPPSLIFFPPERMHVTCVLLLAQKLILSGSRSCNAKIQFLPATTRVLFALLPYPPSCDCDGRTLGSQGEGCLTIVDNQLTEVVW